MVPFYPARGANQVVTPAAASASISLEKSAQAVRLVNSGANICYVRIGSGAQTASISDIPVRAGESVVIGKADGEDTLAHISQTGTTLNVQTGQVRS